MSRRIDNLGRVVLPSETRRLLGIQPGDALDIAVDGGSIVLTKLEVGCALCGNETGLADFLGKQVCTSCADQLARRNDYLDNRVPTA